MKKKTETRKIAEKIQKISGESLLNINISVKRLMDLGICKTRLEAMKELLLLTKDTYL